MWDHQGAVCWVPLPLFCLVCPQWARLVHVFFHYVTPVLRSAHEPATSCYSLAPVLLLLLSIHSLVMSFSARRHPTALHVLHLIQSSAKFRHKTLQHQLSLVLRFRSRTNRKHFFALKSSSGMMRSTIPSRHTPRTLITLCLHQPSFTNCVPFPAALLPSFIANVRDPVTYFSCCISRFL